jgi:hypothetical protein
MTGDPPSNGFLISFHSSMIEFSFVFLVPLGLFI